MTTKLAPECLLAFAGIVYADGHVRKGELEGFRRAARLHGIDGATLEELEARARQGLVLDDIEFPEMTDWQSALTYAFAIWVAKVDGIINREENEMIRELGEKLGLKKLRRDAARSATYDIAALPGGHKPELYDFEALEEQLKKKLPGSYRRHWAAHAETAPLESELIQNEPIAGDLIEDDLAFGDATLDDATLDDATLDDADAGPQRRSGERFDDDADDDQDDDVDIEDAS